MIFPNVHIKDRMFGQRPSALIIEGLLVLVAVVVTIGFLAPATPVEDNSDAVIAELEAIIAAQEAALRRSGRSHGAGCGSGFRADGLFERSAAKNMAWSSLSNEEYRSAIALYDVLIAEGEADMETVLRSRLRLQHD